MPSSRPWRIVILDAHPLSREGLSRLIGAEPGFLVAGEAEDVREALAAASSGADAVVIGLEPLESRDPAALARLRWALPAVPLIAVSLKEGKAAGRQILQEGVSGYVEKARAAGEIIPALHRVLEGGIYGKTKEEKGR